LKTVKGGSDENFFDLFTGSFGFSQYFRGIRGKNSGPQLFHYADKRNENSQSWRTVREREKGIYQEPFQKRRPRKNYRGVKKSKPPYYLLFFQAGKEKMHSKSFPTKQRREKTVLSNP
jgi:hypothetical protein